MPLGTSSPLHLHILQNVALILLSLVSLPIDTFVLLWSFILRPSLAPDKSREKVAQTKTKPGFKQRTILVTGVGMTKGLVLARAFHLAGHRVIGADFEANGALVSGRVSRSLNKFYPMQKPTATSSDGYVQSLLSIIRHEQVDLWVSCSGVASAVSDGEAKEAIERETKCKAIQYDVKTTEMLHEKHTFIHRTQEIGLTVPETHYVESREQLRDIFADAKRKDIKYIMKTVAMDDANRGDMTLFPFASDAETEKATMRISATKERPWIAQQYIKGKEYCTHAVVIRGVVKVFCACPSLELLMHYEALPIESALSKAMLAFTRKFASASGPEFTGHLSFDFLVEVQSQRENDPEKVVLYPIECNPRAHTAVCLFNDTPEMVDAYLSLLDRRKTGFEPSDIANDEQPVFPRHPSIKYHWIGHDFVACTIMPLIELLTGRAGDKDSGVLAGLQQFTDYMLNWKDGTYEVWDPLPWWWLYHVYWPMQFLNAAVTGAKWSRVNVSTTKIFMC